jgi:hypothetical protein
MVAGGGGGAGAIAGGGGGAGGLLHHTNQTISSVQKTIVVGNGGIGGIGWSNGTASRGTIGNNTTFTGFDNAIAIGGGAGGEYQQIGGSGGSGGGGQKSTSATGASGQGYAGGSSVDSNIISGGGGGAGGAGGDAEVIANTSGSGGLGLDKSSIFGTIYGDSGWFASGGGGGSRTDNSTNPGSASQGGGTAGTGNTTKAQDAQKHTGGGGGGGGYSVSSNSRLGGDGGSGIVLIKSPGIGKTIAKVKDIVIDPTNDSNVLISTQGTGISTVTYSVDSGSEVSTPVSQLSVAHGLAENVTGTLLAYALNASSARLGVKLSKSFTTPYGYETFTITQHVNASQTLSITDNGTDNITSVYKNSGSSAWDAGFYTPTFNAPITLEFNKTAPSTTSSSDVRIGITDTPTVNTTTMLDNMSYYFRSRQTSIYQITEKTGVGSVSLSAWDGSKKHYIVYKTNGGLEFWNGDDLKFSVANWGVGKSVRFETGHLDNNSTLNNTLTNIRMKRREWDGTKYIN